MNRVTLTLVAISLLASSSALAVDKKAVNALWKGMGPCIKFMRTKRVSDNDYWKYVESRKAAMAIDPGILTYEKKVSGRIPKDVIPICDKLVSDYEKGIGYENESVSSACRTNMSKRLDPIAKRYYPRFKADPKRFKVWLARKDLEAARWYMTIKLGFKTGGRVCAVNDRFKKGFGELAEKLKKAEALVQEMEKAKGVVFVEVRNNTAVIYKDAKTGKELARSDQI